MVSNSLLASQTGHSAKYPPYHKWNFLDKWILGIALIIKDSRLKRKNNTPTIPFGIRMYVGLPGTGKTLSMVEYLNSLKRANPKIQIYSNFGYTYETAPIESLDDLYSYNSEDGIVFAVDEVQLSFQARKYEGFPSEMIFLLTQNRKFKKHFVCTAQLFEHVDKIFRDLTNIVVECRNFGSRLFFQRAFLSLDYRRTVNDLLSTKETAGFIMWSYFFVATDDIYNAYDTYKVVKSFNKEKKDDKKNYFDEMRVAHDISRFGGVESSTEGEPPAVVKNLRFV